MSVNVWEHVLARVEAKVNRHSFFTWFKPTSFVADDGRTVTIRVPNPLFKDWLTKHYAVVLDEALREAGRPDTALAFLAGEGDPAVPPAPPPPNGVVAPTGATRGCRSPASRTRSAAPTPTPSYRHTSPEAIEAIKKHRAAGHRTVLMTGSIQTLAEPLAGLFDEVVGGHMHDRDGILTGYLAKPPLVDEARAAWVRKLRRGAWARPRAGLRLR